MLNVLVVSSLYLDASWIVTWQQLYFFQEQPYESLGQNYVFRTALWPAYVCRGAIHSSNCCVTVITNWKNWWNENSRACRFTNVLIAHTFIDSFWPLCLLEILFIALFFKWPLHSSFLCCTCYKNKTEISKRFVWMSNRAFFYWTCHKKDSYGDAFFDFTSSIGRGCIDIAHCQSQI